MASPTTQRTWFTIAVILSVVLSAVFAITAAPGLSHEMPITILVGYLSPWCRTLHSSAPPLYSPCFFSLLLLPSSFSACLPSLLLPLCVHLGPRSDACAFTYNNRLYILGGDGAANASSDPFAYTNFPLDLSQPVVWHTATPNNSIINPALNTTLLANYLRPCVVTTNGTLLVGGNDLIGYDIMNDKWLGPMNFGGITATLFQLYDDWDSSYERVVKVNDSLWVFEDFANSTATPGSNIYILNLTTFTWTTNQQVGVIPAAILHTALCYVPAGNGMNETIFMLGGGYLTSPPISVQYSQNIWMFDLNTYKWTLAAQQLLLPLDNLRLSYYAPRRTIYAFPGKVVAVASPPLCFLKTLGLPVKRS